jgi:hypothetical protein
MSMGGGFKKYALKVNKVLNSILSISVATVATRLSPGSLFGRHLLVKKGA